MINPEETLVLFAHGLESVPTGGKIKALSDLAESKGFMVKSPDYSGMKDPYDRVEKLLGEMPSGHKNLIMMGSSMGAWVSIKASEKLNPKGLFLLAPAVYVRYALLDTRDEAPAPHADWVEIVHGWRDSTVPVQNVLNFSENHQARLHLLPTDHRMFDQLDSIKNLFSTFLDNVVSL